MTISYNKLSKTDLQHIYPNTTNDKLMEKFRFDEYIVLYNLYRKIFTQYLIKKLGLKDYDDEIEKSELNFEPTKPEDMDLYQFFSANMLKYFYVRNNIYIERLSEEDINFLREQWKGGIKDLDDILIEFIERTFPRVIFEDVGKDDKKYTTFYGPNNGSFMADNDAVIIGMRYDEFYDGGLEDNEWGMQHDAQIMDFLPDLFYKIQRETVNKLPVRIFLIRYNEYSIMRRDQNQKIQRKGEEK